MGKVKELVYDILQDLADTQDYQLVADRYGLKIEDLLNLEKAYGAFQNQLIQWISSLGGRPLLRITHPFIAGKKRSRQLEGVLLMKVYASNIFLTAIKTTYCPAKFAFTLEDTYR